MNALTACQLEYDSRLPPETVDLSSLEYDALDDILESISDFKEVVKKIDEDTIACLLMELVHPSSRVAAVENLTTRLFDAAREMASEVVAGNLKPEESYEH